MKTNLSPRDDHAALLADLERALLAMNRVEVSRILESVKDRSPIDIAEQLIVPVLERLGTCWESGTAALSQIYMSGRICEELIDRILPPASPDRIGKPKIAIAVLDDYHSLGKRIVYGMLRASGFELADYGVGLSAHDLARRVKADEVRILLVSVLMLPSALSVSVLKQELADAVHPVTLVVGGAPFRLDPQLWTRVGADRMGRSASDAVTIVRELTKERAG